jgi:hypothetical protein
MAQEWRKVTSVFDTLNMERWEAMKIIITTYPPKEKLGEDKWAAVAVVSTTSVTGYGKTESKAISDVTKRLLAYTDFYGNI